MSQSYFHVRSNGYPWRKIRRALRTKAPSEACTFAVGAMPGLLAEPLQAGSTHVTTNICNDIGSVGVVRASIVVEHYDPPHRKIG
jgi:hypothetical protein